MKYANLGERLQASIAITLDTRCWEWARSVMPDGYGYSIFGSRTDGSRKVRLAHRVSYEYYIGPIPSGMELDHTCSNRPCIRPDHLEPVTSLENKVRSRRTVCKRGHAMTAENTYITTGRGIGGKSRRCRRCTLDYQRTYQKVT